MKPFHKVIFSLSVGLLALLSGHFTLHLLREFLYKGASPLVIYPVEFLEYAVFAFLGSMAVERAELPGLLVREKGRRRDFLVAMVSLLLVAGNMAIYYLNMDEALRLAPWLGSLTMSQAFFLSLRAGVTEEVAFRLFLLPFATWITVKLTRHRSLALSLGILISSLFFGLILPGFFAAFFMGIALAYIYLERGLLPAMAVHFLGDFTPLALLILFWR